MGTVLPALLPTVLRLKAATGPTSQTQVGRESPSQPPHKRRVHTHRCSTDTLNKKWLELMELWHLD